MTEPAGGREPLRIVIVVSAYPPHHKGGYELRCRDVARDLARRGHKVTVLTSRTGARGVEDDAGVRVVRELHAWPDGVHGRKGTLSLVLGSASDCRRLRREMRKADVVTYWHQSGLSSALLALPRPRRCGVLCDVSSEWLTDAEWTGGNWFRIWEKKAGTGTKRAAKAVLRVLVRTFLRVPTTRPKFPPGRCYFTSQDRKQRLIDDGIDVSDAVVITSGIDLEKFPFAPERQGAERTRLLFLGRFKRQKGLHAAVLALGYLPRNVTMQAIGAIEDPEYVEEVAALARASNALDRVQLGKQVDHAEVPKLLASAGVLLFPSESPEAFSRLVLEAFAVGTPVVGTTLGGTGEVLREGDTGLTFPPGNARELSRQIERVLTDGALRKKLVANARALVESKYALGYTVDQIERLLREESDKAKGHSSGGKSPGAAPS